MQLETHRDTLRITAIVQTHEPGRVYVQIVEPYHHLGAWRDVDSDDASTAARPLFEALADLCVWIANHPTLLEEHAALTRAVDATPRARAARELMHALGDCFDDEGVQIASKARFDQISEAFAVEHDATHAHTREQVLALARRLGCSDGELLWDVWDTLDAALEPDLADA